MGRDLHPKKNKILGISLAVHRLGLGAFTAGALGSIPDQGSKTLQAMQCGQKKKEERKKSYVLSLEEGGMQTGGEKDSSCPHLRPMRLFLRIQPLYHHEIDLPKECL